MSMRRVLTVIATALLLVCIMVSTAFACECGGSHKTYAADPESSVTLITKAQNYLSALGYKFKAPAGKINASMRQALRSFQYDSALTTNQKLNNCTLYRLENRANAVKKNRASKSWTNLFGGNYRLMQKGGNVESRVRILNNALYELGFAPASVKNSRHFTSETYLAVVAFQKKYVTGRKADGKAGPYTLSALERVYGAKVKKK